MQNPPPVFIATGDPEKDKANRINHAVDEAIRLHASIEADKKRLDEIKEQLAELTAGKYFGLGGQRITVVAAGTAIKPGESQVAAARTLAGKHAGKLFTRQIVFKPVGSFRDIVLALLTPKKAEKILALCEVPTSAQVRF